MNQEPGSNLFPQKDYQKWCKENNVEWNLVEETSSSPYPHGNPLFEASALWWAHEVLRKQNFKEQK